MSDILGILLIGFTAISSLTIISIILMFILKSPKAQKIAFYFTAISSVVIAINYAGMTPLYMTGDLLIAGLIGLVSIAGILVERLASDENREKRFKLAKVMVALSALASMIMLMYF